MLEKIQPYYAQSEAAKLSYLDNGTQGETYVFLHGISSGAQSWVKQYLSMGEKYRLIAWNAPGYGKSSPLDTDTPSALDYADQLEVLIEKLDLSEPFTLVGHSLGAMMACGYAEKYGHRLQRLVLVNPAQGYAFSDESKKQSVYEMRPKLLERLGNEGMAEERGPNLLAQKTEENMNVVRAVTNGITMAGLTGSSYLLAYDSIERYLPSISCPIALFYGEEDGITPPQGMFDLQKKFPFLSLTALPEAGHLAYLDQPEFFNAQLFG